MNDHKEFLLSILRVASMRAKTLEVEINSIGVALKADMIDIPKAMEWLKDIGADGLVWMIPESVPEEEK
jgi:hypothetical protein